MHKKWLSFWLEDLGNCSLVVVVLNIFIDILAWNKSYCWKAITCEPTIHCSFSPYMFILPYLAVCRVFSVGTFFECCKSPTEKFSPEYSLCLRSITLNKNSCYSIFLLLLLQKTSMFWTNLELMIYCSEKMQFFYCISCSFNLFLIWNFTNQVNLAFSLHQIHYHSLKQRNKKSNPLEKFKFKICTVQVDGTKSHIHTFKQLCKLHNQPK